MSLSRHLTPRSAPEAIDAVLFSPSTEDAKTARQRRLFLKQERLHELDEETREEKKRQTEFELHLEAARVREAEATRRAHEAATTTQTDWGFCNSCGNDLAGCRTESGMDLRVCAFCGIHQESRTASAASSTAQLAKHLAPSVAKSTPFEPTSQMAQAQPSLECHADTHASYAGSPVPSTASSRGARTLNFI